MLLGKAAVIALMDHHLVHKLFTLLPQTLTHLFFHLPDHGSSGNNLILCSLIFFAK